MNTRSDHSPPPPSWDVFLSFCGKDTRTKFISHLYKDFHQAGIQTFRDEPALKKGQDISSGLLNTIQDSKMFVVVLSENYPRSSWCLDELVHILCSKTTKNQIVPVFYYVDPSDLRHLKGSFGEALENHKQRYSVGTIGKWKSALAEIAEISGYHLKKDADVNEADIVHQIVEDVAPHVSTKNLHLGEPLFGIDSAVEEMYLKLCMESNDVRAIGICGMGGIGKTTTAKSFYNKYSNRFDICCFIENVKQPAHESNPLLVLLEQFLSELLRRRDSKVTDVQSGKRKLKENLVSKKALIVLDDLDHSSYLELLVWLFHLVSPGSRIIITTRDENMVNKLKVDISGVVDIYRIKALGLEESLELFSYHAFRKTMPPDNFRKFSLMFVNYVEGLPLALKVVGASLLGRSELSFWKAQLEKVRVNPEIHNVLRLSYDALSDEKEKAVFLDIVFFFIKKDKDDAAHVLESCGFYPDAGIPILVERCLLSIDQSNRFQMHNIIQDMGREVISMESKQGNCRRLHLFGENACQALQNLEAVNKLEGLILDLRMSTNVYASAKLFERLSNLRLLEVISAHNFEGNFQYSFHELRCIRWYHCPSTYLPSGFHPQKLVFLDMPFNKFKSWWKSSKLTWNIKQPCGNLKIINMSFSEKLIKTPNVKYLKMVEKLCFGNCYNLLEVHPSIGQLRNLSDLDLSRCSNLKELPETIGQLTKLGQLDLSGCVNLKRLPEHIKQLTNLSSLSLGDCKNLKQLPEQLGDMKGLKMLDASHTAIEQLPDSIVQLTALGSLNLHRCKKLRKFPEQFGDMKCLKKLDASESGIEVLPDSIGQLINLAHLELSYCKSLTSLPESICKLKLLVELSLSYCSKLERLPEQLGKMHSLEKIHAYNTAIREVPDSIENLSKLQSLNFDFCKKLKDVPSSIWNLTSLVKLYLPYEDDMFTCDMPVTVNYLNKLEHLSLRCNIRLWLPTILSFSSLEYLYLCDDGRSLSSSTKWFSLSTLSNLKILTLLNWGSSLPKLPLNLTTLNLCNNATLEELQDLSNLKQLQKLDIWKCISLQSLPPLPLNLRSLYVGKCTSLKDVPDLSMLKELRELGFIQCSNLKQSHLQVPPPDTNYDSSFSAYQPNGEISEWFDYKSSGSTVSFEIPSSVLGDDFLGIAFWVVYRYKNPKPIGNIEVVITNKSAGIKRAYDIKVDTHLLGEAVQHMVQCMCRHRPRLSMKSGDRIHVSIQKVEKCGEEEEICGGRETLSVIENALCFILYSYQYIYVRNIHNVFVTNS